MSNENIDSTFKMKFYSFLCLTFQLTFRIKKENRKDWRKVKFWFFKKFIIHVLLSRRCFREAKAQLIECLS